MRVIHELEVKRRFLLYVRCGSHSLVPKWYNSDKERQWDLALSYYESTGDDRQAFDNLFRGCGSFIGGHSKFSSFYDLCKQGHLEYHAYQAVMFLDDDILLSFGEFDRLFNILSQLNLHLAQPSLDRHSHASWPITLQCRDSFLRFTNFVEIMMPIMSSLAVDICFETFNQSISGWGLDFVWPKLLGYPAKGIAVIDAVTAIHTKAMDPLRGKFYRYLASLEIEPQAEARNVMRLHQLQGSHIAPRVVDAIRSC